MPGLQCDNETCEMWFLKIVQPEVKTLTLGYKRRKLALPRILYFGNLEWSEIYCWMIRKDRVDPSEVAMLSEYNPLGMPKNSMAFDPMP